MALTTPHDDWQTHSATRPAPETEARWPAGWWLLPSVLIGLWMWVKIFQLIF